MVYFHLEYTNVPICFTISVLLLAYHATMLAPTLRQEEALAFSGAGWAGITGGMVRTTIAASHSSVELSSGHAL